MIALGLMLTIAGIILLIAGAAQAAQNHAFRDAQKVMGNITYKHRIYRKNGSAYLFKLSYTVDGIAYEREVGVSMTDYDTFEVGEQYEVLYRPDKPKRILNTQAANPKNVKTVLILGTIFIAVGIAMVIIGRFAGI